jgi:hypothetical protein
MSASAKQCYLKRAGPIAIFYFFLTLQPPVFMNASSAGGLLSTTNDGK